jgi:hypothetical protein
MPWHFTFTDNDSRTITDPTALTVQSRGELSPLIKLFLTFRQSANMPMKIGEILICRIQHNGLLVVRLCGCFVWKIMEREG